MAERQARSRRNLRVIAFARGAGGRELRIATTSVRTGFAMTWFFVRGVVRFIRCVGAGLSCPPLCQPIPGHCRGRQSGHFLEIASLLPPPAALRRFPLPWAVEPRPYGSNCRGGRLCPPGPGNAKPCRAGPVCPAGVRGKNPPVTASPCQPPLGKGAEGTRDADCHNQ